MVDHFHEQVLALNKIGGQARAMVVTSGIERAIQYFHAFSDYLTERKSPYQAIVAFSGEHEYGGAKVTEASLNGFPSSDIADKIQEDPYRFLICADKFQTGYDEPLLHTMYVDKPLSGIKAVQTLSRLNRAHPQKHDCFVLDFQNNTETIHDVVRRTTTAPRSSARRPTPTSCTTSRRRWTASRSIRPSRSTSLVELYLGGADRDKLDPILDACVAVYMRAARRGRPGGFQGQGQGVRPHLRLPRRRSCPTPTRSGRSSRSSSTSSCPSCPRRRRRTSPRASSKPSTWTATASRRRPRMQMHWPMRMPRSSPCRPKAAATRPSRNSTGSPTSSKDFNDQFGNIAWDGRRPRPATDREDIPTKVAADAAYQNAKQNSDKQNARIEHDKALGSVMIGVLKDDTELFKQFSDNPEFKRWLADTIFSATYDRPAPAAS